KPKRAGGGDLGTIGSGGKVDGEGLTADRVGEMNVVGDAVAFAGINSDELSVLAHLNTFQYAEILPAAALHPDAHLFRCFHVRQGAAVQNGQLQIVELDDDIVDAHADERGKKML